LPIGEEREERSRFAIDGRRNDDDLARGLWFELETTSRCGRLEKRSEHTPYPAHLHAQARAVRFVGSPRSERDPDELIAWRIFRPSFAEHTHQREQHRALGEGYALLRTANAMTTSIDHECTGSEPGFDMIDAQELVVPCPEPACYRCAQRDESVFDLG
jgi:hypothetical protein